MDELLTLFLDKPVTLQDQAVIQISGYDMDYYEYLFKDWQVLIYRSHKNPVITKVIIENPTTEFNYTLAQENVCLSHFLEYYTSLSTLSDKQLGLITGKLEQVSYYLREQSLFYKMDRPERSINVYPQELRESLRDYVLLKTLIENNYEQPVVQLFLALNIDVQPEYLFLQSLESSHRVRN